MKLIPLSTKGKNPVIHFAMVDDEDYEHLIQWNWYAFKCKNTQYACRVTARPERKMVPMQSQILNITESGEIGDHIDHNGLNNQKSNLRRATKSENNKNKSKRSDGVSSKFIGVHFNKQLNKWVSQIRNKDTCVKTKHLGCFVSEIDAAIAYNGAAILIHGKFANLNKFDDL